MCCSIVKVSKNIGGAIAPLAPPKPPPPPPPPRSAAYDYKNVFAHKCYYDFKHFSFHVPSIQMRMRN